MVIICGIIALYKRIHAKFDLSFSMEEQTQMAESAVERLNHMNFLLEDSVDFGFDVHHMPHSNDNTWQKFTLGEFH